MTLDDLRARFDGVGFALYAMQAGEPVKLELHFADGTYMTLTDWTVAGLITQAAATLAPPESAPEDIFE